MPSHDNRLTRIDFHTLCDAFMDFADSKLMDEQGVLSEDFAYLHDSFPNAGYVNQAHAWNIEKVRILLELFKLESRDEAIKVLSYMEHTRYGWKGHEYIFSNSCLYLREQDHCKCNHKIDNTPEMTERAFESVQKIFLDSECGGITTYLFGYSLVALFSSRLKLDKLRVPYFLQISCERNSNLYRLIHEIVEICDVNTSLLEHCTRVLDYGYCDCDYTTIFPTQHTEKALEDLVCHRDVPVIIDGYESEKFYAAMLRDIANIPGKKSVLGIKDRFNILPIFVCPVIKSSFKNVFNMTLTDFDISSEYLELIRTNKQMLASWVFELVKYGKDIFEPRETTYDIIHHKTEDERPFFKAINNHINLIRKKYRSYINLDSKDITNIGFLSYFFFNYMRVFSGSIRLVEGVEFKFNDKMQPHKTSELITQIFQKSIDSLVELHGTNSPLLFQNVNIDAKGNLTSVEIKRAKKKGEKYAKNIIKYYQSYGVAIRILPNAEFEKDRYIFHVELLPGTDKKLISRYADEIRRLLGLEFFMPDVRHSSIKIIASEKPLEENSLINILNSKEFKESKMKIPYAVGYDMLGEMVITDIAEFPHLLVGGTTGSGKSTALHSLLMSIVWKQSAENVRLMLLDFGASGLNMFANTPHLALPVITLNDFMEGHNYILFLRKIMESRLTLLEENKKELDKEPSIVCVIDEFPAFIYRLSAVNVIGNKETYIPLIDLLSRARKVKIHIILATQDATKENIKLKTTNLPAAIAFRCKSWRESMAILDAPDARYLSGKGSLYFQSYQHEGLLRMQGSFMDPEEIIERLQNMDFDGENVDRLALNELNEYQASSSTEEETDSKSINSEYRQEHRLVEIIMWALSQEMISNKMIKDNFDHGYEVSKRFLDKLELLGIVEDQREGAKLKRTVIPKCTEDLRDDVVALLSKHGISAKAIADAFIKRQSKTNTPDV